MVGHSVEDAGLSDRAVAGRVWHLGSSTDVADVRRSREGGRD